MLIDGDCGSIVRFEDKEIVLNSNQPRYVAEVIKHIFVDKNTVFNSDTTIYENGGRY